MAVRGSQRAGECGRDDSSHDGCQEGAVIVIIITTIITITISTTEIPVTRNDQSSLVKKLVSLNSWEELRQCSSRPIFLPGGYGYCLSNITLQVNYLSHRQHLKFHFRPSWARDSLKMQGGSSTQGSVNYKDRG